jgi:hypothetical protein
LQLDFILEAPAPILAGLKRGDDRVMRAGRVLASVAVFRIIAASHVATGAAQPEVHPGIAHRQAFNTTIAGWSHWLYTIEMFAMLIGAVHESP